MSVGLVEWSTGVLFAVCAARFGWSWTLWPALVFVTGAVAISAVDIRVRRVPTRAVAVAAGSCLTLIAAGSIATGAQGSLVGAGIGSVAAGGLMLVLHVLSPGGLGMGDVRLAGLVGLVAGWRWWAPDDWVAGPVGAALAALFVGCVVALATHGVMALRGWPSRSLPFAPAMTVGALVVLVWSES